MRFESKSNEQTIKIGKKLASKLKGGDIVLLYGELGTGKTVLTKGIAKELGVGEEIVSPTFTLMNVYQIKNHKSKIINLVHIDTYRLESEDELMEIGVEDYLGDKNTVCVIEWPEKIVELFKDKKTMDITIEHVGENERKIVM